MSRKNTASRALCATPYLFFNCSDVPDFSLSGFRAILFIHDGDLILQTEGLPALRCILLYEKSKKTVITALFIDFDVAAYFIVTAMEVTDGAENSQ
ncbi:hypothetical protein K7I13_09455 [Brucepastera parasyntrophica]|uniref:hypothetical protein n=1 Tax=Brucepastera parasyntrophica TaxID=2880008 RepID=UPI002108CA76|nr:hypothetical protein [Brucepastera parasyntrophica]ULQ58774.1 hypothetical protein K7I13_09455 [Brucepastera parasyntrophica]